MAAPTIVSTTQTTAVLLDANGEDLLVTNSGSIVVNSSGFGVDASADVSSRNININGIVYNTAGGALKIGTSSANTDNNIILAGSADILAGGIAVDINGTGINFSNAGTVQSLNNYALKASAASSTFVNSGNLTSVDRAVVLLNGSSSEMINNGTIAKVAGGLNDNSAVIDLGIFSSFTNNGVMSAEDRFDSLVEFLGSSNMTFTNNGTARGSLNLDVGSSTVENFGLLDGNVSISARVFFSNAGVINGSITCGSENDFLDLRGGYVKRGVSGGDGDDQYFIDRRTEADISDSAGIDTLSANFSLRLRPIFENLALLGTDDYAGTGNKLDNRLDGNSGGNILKGLAGADTLTGGAGRDILIGGSKTDGEIDTFAFREGDGTDIARGFQVTTAKHDMIDLSDFDLDISFGAFKIDNLKQVGKNVHVDMDNGDILIVEGTKLEALKESFFIFE